MKQSAYEAGSCCGEGWVKRLVSTRIVIFQE